MERSQIHRVSVADQVAGILRQRILEGELRPGAALMEIPLASSLGVSRNTMREAMRILALEGLLKRNIHRGVLVSQLSLQDVEEIYRLRSEERRVGKECRSRWPASPQKRIGSDGDLASWAFRW